MFIAFLVASAAATNPVPRVTPIDKRSWFTGDDYPAAAARAGIEGSVTFEADVDASGSPTDCRITKSSGHPELDKATCDIIRARAHFKPAHDRAGKPIAGRFSDRTVWRLMGPTGATYHALILDFSADPDKPVCTVKENVASTGGLTCERMLKTVPEDIGKRVIKLVYLATTSSGDQKPYAGEPDWGERVSYVANEQYLLKGPMPVACVPIAAEGMAAGHDACSEFPGARTLSEEEKKASTKLRVEVSTFAARRPTAPSTTCKSGESAAESQACQ